MWKIWTEVFGGFGGLRGVREACRNHFYQFSLRSQLVVPSSDQKTKRQKTKEITTIDMWAYTVLIVFHWLSLYLLFLCGKKTKQKQKTQRKNRTTYKQYRIYCYRKWSILKLEDSSRNSIFNNYAKKLFIFWLSVIYTRW